MLNYSLIVYIKGQLVYEITIVMVLKYSQTTFPELLKHWQKSHKTTDFDLVTYSNRFFTRQKDEDKIFCVYIDKNKKLRIQCLKQTEKFGQKEDMAKGKVWEALSL